MEARPTSIDLTRHDSMAAMITATDDGARLAGSAHTSVGAFVVDVGACPNLLHWVGRPSSDDGLTTAQADELLKIMDGEIMDQLMGKYMHQHVLR